MLDVLTTCRLSLICYCIYYAHFHRIYSYLYSRSSSYSFPSYKLRSYSYSYFCAGLRACGNLLLRLRR